MENQYYSMLSQRQRSFYSHTWMITGTSLQRILERRMIHGVHCDSVCTRDCSTNSEAPSGCKYTFYSAYGFTTNSNALPAAFGILFGNVDASYWIWFWTFTKSLHPHLDGRVITIITDQDKGLINDIIKVSVVTLMYY